MTGRPFTGAWIETEWDIVSPPENIVAPSRGRGLKLVLVPVDSHTIGRPFTGAWIETLTRRVLSRMTRVAPSRGRGLKLNVLVQLVESLESPLHGGVD